MTRQQIVELYGQNVYQVRLQIAIALYVGSEVQEPEDAFRHADYFIRHMESDEHGELELH